MDTPLSTRPPRTMLITACSAVFYDHYTDLLNSLEAIGVRSQFDIGVLDLGLEPDQIASLQARGAACKAATWPVEPPARQNRPEFVAFAGKPFARDYFPGYDIYVWMDADMWVQTPAFWTHLIEGALRTGCAVPHETHSAYSPMPMRERLWMLRHLSALVGPLAALRLCRLPMVNNGVFAMHADAPHWLQWQRRFVDIVSKTQRMIAVDQLAMQAMIYLDQPHSRLLGALDNWVCSLATPAWDPISRLFVSPDLQQPISVLHITTPSRARQHMVQTLGGTAAPRYLHRPGGAVMASLLGQANTTVCKAPIAERMQAPVKETTAVAGS